MTRPRIYIAPQHADNAELRAHIEATNPGAEIYPRRRWRDRMSKSVPPARTELTTIGEQFVIPGCEKNRTQATGSQLDLWS